MKKMVKSLAVLVAVVMLTACSATDAANDKMYIQKAELSTEEQTVLDLVGMVETLYILDFAVDDTVQALQINTYELQGDAWRLISGGGSRQLKDAHGRIALTFDNIGLGLKIGMQNEKGSTRYITDTDYDFKDLGTSTAYLSDKTTVVYEKEIPLVIQIHTSKSSISSLDPEYAFYEPQAYKDSGHEKVYAITCLFSQKTVNELSAQRVGK